MIKITKYEDLIIDENLLSGYDYEISIKDRETHASAIYEIITATFEFYNENSETINKILCGLYPTIKQWLNKKTYICNSKQIKELREKYGDNPTNEEKDEILSKGRNVIIVTYFDEEGNEIEIKHKSKS